MRTRRLGFGVVAAILLAVGCGGLNPPPQLGPAGDAYFRANKVVLGLGSVKSVAISAEAQGLISRNDADTVLTAVKKALFAADDLVKAVHAGAAEDGTKARAMAVINQLLNDVLPQLSPHAQQVILPYITVVRSALAVLA